MDGGTYRLQNSYIYYYLQQVLKSSLTSKKINAKNNPVIYYFSSNVLGIIRWMNENGTLNKEVDVQNIRCNFVQVRFVDVYPFNRY